MTVPRSNRTTQVNVTATGARTTVSAYTTANLFTSHKISIL